MHLLPVHLMMTSTLRLRWVVAFSLFFDSICLAASVSIPKPGAQEAKRDRLTHRPSNVTLQDKDIHCYGGQEMWAFRVYEESCYSSIDFVITRDGPTEFTRRQPFYWGPGSYPGVHRVPDSWIGVLRDPAPCKIELTVAQVGANEEHYDFFKLEDVARVAQRILQRCVRSRPYLKLGGEGYVGNGRGFIVTLNGVLGEVGDDEAPNSTVSSDVTSSQGESPTLPIQSANTS